MPSISATPLPAFGWVRLELDWSDVPGVEYVQVERVASATGEATPIRPHTDYSGWYQRLSGGKALLYDTEAPLDALFYYRTSSLNEPDVVHVGPAYAKDGFTRPAALATAAINDPFTRAAASGTWGAAPTGEPWTLEGGNVPGDYALTGTTATQSTLVVTSSRRSSIGPVSVDSDVTVTATPSATAAGAGVLANVMLRYQDVDNMIMCGVRLNPSGTVQARIVSRVAATETELANFTVPGLVHAGGSALRIQGQAIGTLLRVRVWNPAGSAPTHWHASAVSNAWMTAGKVGVRLLLESGNTNTLPFTVTYDDFVANVGPVTVQNGAIARQNLVAWRVAANRAPSTPATVAVIGSSTAAGSMGTQSSDTRRRSTTMLGAVLRARHNAPGVPGGYGVSVANIGIPNEWTRSGGTNVPNRGLGFTAWQLAPGEWVSRPWFGTAVTVLYEQGAAAGAFDVSIDGGPATRVTPLAGAPVNTGRWRSPTLSVGNHTVKITAVGTATIEAVYGHDRDEKTGVQTWNGGLPGITTAELAATPGLITRLAEMRPELVVLNQTANDFASGVDPAVSKQRIQTWLSDLYAAIPDNPPDVLLVHQHERFDVVTPAYPWTAYGTALQDIANADPRVYYTDVSSLFPTSQGADTADLIDSDSTHLTERGHTVLTDALAGVVALDPAAGWNAAESGEAWTTNPSADHSVTGGTGRQTANTVGVLRTALIEAYGPDQRISADVKIPVLPTGAGITGWALVRVTDTSNYYAGALSVGTSGVTSLLLSKRVANVLTSGLASFAVGTHAAGNTWRIIVEVIGSVVRGKAWNLTTGTEPSTWQVSVYDGSLTTGTLVGLGSRLETGNTNATPVVIEWDNFAASNLSEPTAPLRTLESMDGFWLRSPLHPAKDRLLQLKPTPGCPPTAGKFFVGTEPSEQYAGNSATLAPLNRRLGTYMARPRRGVEGALTLVARTFADRDEVLDTTSDGTALQFAAPPEYGIPLRYLGVGDVTVQRGMADHRFQPRIITLPYVQVAQPAGPATGVAGARHKDLCAYATWDAAAAAGKTYDDLIRVVD